MLGNYIISAIRFLVRNPAYTLINVFGLSVGIGSAYIIFHILAIQTNFDTFHSKKDRIFRVVTDSDDNGRPNTTQGTPMPMAPALKNDFPEIETTTRTYYAEEGLIAIPSRDGSAAKFQEKEGIAFIEPAFFDMFDFPVTAGSVSELARPHTAVLTESMAQKYFGAENPIGKTIRFDNRFEFRVVAIARDFPARTDLPFTVMMSLESARNNKEMLGGLDFVKWSNIASNTNTWVLLRDAASATELEKALQAFNKKYFDDPNNDRVYRLHALEEVHYDVDYGSYSNRTEDRSKLLALKLVAFFLVLTACINFVNLATAQASRRAREMGVRKVLGAYRRQLIFRFLGETFLITVLSACVALGLSEIIVPKVLTAIGLDGLTAPTSQMVIFLLLTLLGVTLLAGLYPGFILSGFKPVSILKGSVAAPHGRLALRRGLVVTQFIISQILIIATLVAIAQVDYMHKKDLGFDRTAILTVPLPSTEGDKLDILRARLRAHASIEGVTCAFAVGAANYSWNTTISLHVRDREERVRTNMRVADDQYVPMLGLKILAGRNHLPGDTLTEFVVNETFVRTAGLSSAQDAVGQTVRLYERQIPIVGVVADWNSSSLHSPVRPSVIGNFNAWYQEAGIRIRWSQSDDALKFIEKTWSEIYPEHVYSFQFLDERIERFYRQDVLVSNMFTSFAAIALAIGCLGLFGLVAFMVDQKTKEISVRKVLGAGVPHILSMFVGEFMKLIAIAFVVAAPLAYYAMQRWLQDFEYRVSLGAGVFILAIAVSCVIAGLTVGYQVTRAANANPVDALKYE